MGNTAGSTYSSQRADGGSGADGPLTAAHLRRTAVAPSITATDWQQQPGPHQQQSGPYQQQGERHPTPEAAECRARVERPHRRRSELARAFSAIHCCPAAAGAGESGDIVQRDATVVALSAEDGDSGDEHCVEPTAEPVAALTLYLLCDVLLFATRFTRFAAAWRMVALAQSQPDGRHTDRELKWCWDWRHDPTAVSQHRSMAPSFRVERRNPQ
jgi:hypothetical protein